MDRITGKIYVVTGVSSGIGESIAHTLADRGAIVYGLSRRLAAAYQAKLGIFIPVSADVTIDSSVDHAIRTILQEQGTIYGVINCAGSGIAGALEDCAADEILEQLNINTVGALRVTNASLPAMREKGEGVVINIGSIGGDFALPYQGAYSMSKAALRKETETLRLEMRRFGIQACCIEPGDLKTGFTAARRFSSKTSGSVHEAAANRAVAQMAHDEQNGKDPICVTNKVIAVLKKKTMPACVAVGGSYVVFPVLNRMVPYRLVEFILGKMYHI